MTVRGKDDIIFVREKDRKACGGVCPARGLRRIWEGLRMEALLIKFSILAGVFGIIGLIGLAALLASVIWLIIRVANFDSVLPALLCVLVSIALAVGGMFLSPAPEGRAAPYLRASWEAPLEALKGQIGKLKELKDNGPWARFFKDEGEPGEMETMDVIRTGAPDRVLVDETMDGWRVRLTLPREWKELCVVENDGRLNFSQKVSLQEEGGWLFSLSLIEGPYDSEGPDALPACETVLEKDGMTLLAIYPTDVQFNDAAEEIAEEYQRMQAEIPGILETVEFETT